MVDTPAFSVRFLACLPYTLIQECPFPSDWSNLRNYSDDPGDSGGATMCGITHREYDLWRKAHGLPTQDVIKLGKDEGYSIYWASYWLPHCAILKPGLDLFMFDTSVNMGSGRGVMLLQASLGLKPDGDWGPLTDAAVAKIVDVKPIIIDEENRREAVYRSFGGFARFGVDWTRRDREIGAESLKMAA